MNVSVQTDSTEVEDWGCRAHDIEGDPSVAITVPEWPTVEQIVDQGKGHHQAGDEEIGDCQRNHEQVADFAQITVGVNGEADEDVAEHGQEDDAGQDDTWKMRQDEGRGVRWGELEGYTCKA